MIATRKLSEVPRPKLPKSGCVQTHVSGAAIHVFENHDSEWRSFKYESVIAVPFYHILTLPLTGAASLSSRVEQPVEAARRATEERRRRDEEERRKVKQEESKRQAAAQAAAAEAERQRNAAAAEAERQRTAAATLDCRREFRGVHCEFSIGHTHTADQLMRRSNSLNTVTHLTLVGDGFFMARENGGSFWSGLPAALHSNLEKKGLNTQGAVKYMAAGPGGLYYADVGTGMWCSGKCSESFVEAMNEASSWGCSISRVAFASKYSWIVLYSDGSSTWEGLPTRLHNKLQSRNPRLSKPVEVTLGQNETWYVKFADGSHEYCLPSEVANTCKAYSDAGWQVSNVLLNSANGDWLVRYS